MEKFDFIASFYDTPHDRENLLRVIDSLIVSEQLSVNAIPFASNFSIKDLFGKIKSYKKKILLKNEKEGAQLYELAYNINDVNKKSSGRFFIYEHPEYKNVYVALTIEGGEFYRHALLPLLQGLYPRIILTFITHKRLRKLLEEFQTKHQFKKLIITRASYRLRFEEEKKIERFIPGVSWPNVPLKEAFDWIYQNDGWFQSLQFKMKDDSFFSTRISLNRQGIIQTNGMFQKVFESFVLPVCRIIYRNSEFFGNRSRKEDKDLLAKPLMIDFGTEQFAEVAENERFINSVKRFKRASTSVLHGNPYVHMSIIDYYDGSAFDLWVVNLNQLFIVPQMKGTVAAIKRLINHIFDTYAEGEIRDYSGLLHGTSR